MKLKDYLRGAGVPLHLRDSIPVVEMAAGGAAAGGGGGGEGGAAEEGGGRDPSVIAVYPAAVGAGFCAPAPRATEAGVGVGSGGGAPPPPPPELISVLLRIAAVADGGRRGGASQG